MQAVGFNFEKMCRICTKENDNLESIFNSYLTGNSEFVVADCLCKIADLQIKEDDGLPSMICPQCLLKISDTYDLIQLATSSDLALRNYLLDKEKTFEISEEEIELSDYNVEEKYKIEIQVPKEKYTCQVCNVFFTNKKDFVKHERIHDVHPFKCDECSQTFPKKTQLNLHLRAHIKSEDKRYRCQVCGQNFAYEYLLKRHQFKHSDKQPYHCSKCNKGYLISDNLKKHMKIHDENYTKKKHVCKICSKEFLYISILSEHMKIHTGEKPHLCSTCGKGFRQSGALHFHQRSHNGHKPFSCKTCEERFMSKSLLKIHMRRHTNERPYVCHICGMAFRRSTDLRGHQRVHSGDKPVLCTICGKKMSTTGQLTVHIRSHTGEKPFTCSHCNKAFTTRTTLVKHERIHTGERPYICDVCGKAFNQSSTLKSHKNTHQMNSRMKRIINKYLGEKSDNCVVQFKNGSEHIETEIVTEQFVDDLKNNDSVKAEFTVILPAPIPLVNQIE